MAKAVRTVAMVVGAVALIGTGIGAALGGTMLVAAAGTAVAASTIAMVAGGIATVAGMFVKPPEVPGSQTERLRASVDPRAFRKTVLGSTAMPVDVRYAEWFGPNQERCGWIVALASHRIDGVDEIWFDDERAWSASGGVAAKFSGYFWVRAIRTEGSASTVSLGRWGSSHRLTGCAYAHLEFKVTGNSKKAESPFASGLPSRVTIVGRGAPLYDPRRDSTAGGAGGMRADNEATWSYSADGSVLGENVALQILRVLIGGRINGKLATGCGVPLRRLDLQSFATAANLCDELVNRSVGGTEPRFRAAGVLSEGDDPEQMLTALCAACCGRLTDVGGKLGLAIAHNDLAEAASDDGLNTDDVVGPFNWNPDPGMEATPNTVRGRYTDPSRASLYQLLPYPDVTLPQGEAGEVLLPLDLGLVESPSQAQRIAKQALQRKQYQGTFTAPFDIRAWKYRVGQVVPFTFAPLSFERRLFRVIDQEPGSLDQCVMTLRMEHQQIYAWDRDDRAPVLAADPIVYDSRNNPLILAIDDAAGTALWEGVSGNGKPEDGATVGAPWGTTIGDRPVEDFISQLDKLAGVISGGLIPEAVQVPAFADGSVQLANIRTEMRVLSGVIDVSDEFVLTIGANPQALATSTAGNVITITGAGSGPEGFGSPSVDRATLGITATGTGDFAGIVVEKILTLQKLKGGYETLSALPTSNLFEGRLVFNNADKRLYTYKNGAWVSLIDTVTPISADNLTGNIKSSQLDVKFGANMLAGAVPGANAADFANVGWNPDNVPLEILSPDFSGSYPAPSTYSLPDRSTLAFHQTSGFNGSYGVSDLQFFYRVNPRGDFTERWAVQPGKTYEFSAYLVSHRCTASLLLVYYNEQGQQIDQITSSPTTREGFPAYVIDHYERLVARLKAPPGAAFARLLVRKGHTLPGHGDSWVFLARAMMGETSATANEPLPWSPPGYGIINAQNILARSIKTDQLDAKSVQTKNLAVADFENLAVNGALVTGTLDGWSRVNANGGSQIYAADGGEGTSWPSRYALWAFKAPGDGGEFSIVNGNDNFDNSPQNAGIKLEPNDEVYFEAILYCTSANYVSFDFVTRGVGNSIYVMTAVALENMFNWEGRVAMSRAATFTKVSGYFKNNSGQTVAGNLRYWPSNAEGDTSYLWNLKMRRRNNANLVVDGAIDANKIRALAINGNHIAGDVIDANHLRAGAVTAAKVNVTDLSAIAANLGHITAGYMQSPGGNTVIDLNSARITFMAGGFMKVTGIGFGSANQFIEWYGPQQPNLASCTEDNALTYQTTDGRPYWGGATSNSDASSGYLYNEVLTSDFAGMNKVLRVVPNATSLLLMIEPTMMWDAQSSGVTIVSYVIQSSWDGANWFDVVSERSISSQQGQVSGTRSTGLSRVTHSGLTPRRVIFYRGIARKSNNSATAELSIRLTTQ